MDLPPEIITKIEILAAKINLPAEEIIRKFFETYFSQIESYYLNTLPLAIKPKDLIPLPKVVEILNYASNSTVAAKLKKGIIRGEKIGNMWHVPAAEVEKLRKITYRKGRKRGSRNKLT
jgi:hypothetical protein